MTSILNVGLETVVPATTAGNQSEPKIAQLADGGYVITWNGINGDSDVYMQRYDATGHKLGTETRVNTTTTGLQAGGAIAALSDGGFVIAWQSTTDNTIAGMNVLAQRYDNLGHAVGGEFVVSGAAGGQYNIQVVATVSGGFAFIWESQYSGTDDDILGRIYSPDGSNSPGFNIASTSDYETNAAFTALTNGGFASTYFVGSTLTLKVINPDFSVIPIVLSTSTYGPADVTALSDGGFVVTWTSSTSNSDISLQTFDNYGVATSAIMTANSYTPGTQTRSSVAALDDGGFVVVWGSDGQDGDSLGIFAQRYDAAHQPIGVEFQVNTYTKDVQFAPAVAALANGGFVVTWHSAGEDGSGIGVYQKVYSSAATTVGNQTLWGTADADVLDGGSGADTMYGGLGDDTYVVGSTLDVVFERAGEGNDSVESAISYALGDNVENLTLTGAAALNGSGNALDNVLTGNKGVNYILGEDGNDTIDGGAGNDKLDGGNGDDVINGGNGNDIIYASNGQDFAGGDSGIDTYDASTGTGAAKINLASRSTQNGYTTYLENIENVIGTTFDDSITGTNGDNVINGGAGADKMAGLLGDDTYYVDNVGDVVAESSDAVLGGNDTVISSISYTLGNYIENLTLIGGDAINGTGNTLDNVIIGNSGNNILDGKAGNDTMSGSLGDDTYYVDAVGDTVVELAGQGTDTVRSSVSYSLGQNVENLILTGTANINGGGNGDANSLTGNSGNNTLDGGTGADVMAGGNGDDNYYVDNSGDVVADSSDATLGGHDQVISSITYVLGNYIEDLLLTGTANINGTGNALNNIIVGNDGSNLLDGKAGSDTMTGGLGDDTYVVDVAGDVVVEQAVQGTDMVKAGLSYILGANVENLILTGTGNFNGTGTGDANTITGNAGNNIIDGGAGADIMAGGLGDDTYVVDNVGDVVNDYSGAGNDTILASVSYTLSGRYVETLQLTGSANINAIGNAQDNRLVSNTGNNSLTGGTGADTFVFLLGSHADTITDFTVGDNDTIDATAFHAVAHTVTQSGTSVIIDFGSGNTVTVLKTTVADVNAHTLF